MVRTLSLTGGAERTVVVDARPLRRLANVADLVAPDVARVEVAYLSGLRGRLNVRVGSDVFVTIRASWVLVGWRDCADPAKRLAFGLDESDS